MTVCQFYLRGYCKFGERCRNEHPAKGEINSFNSRNPFDALGNNGARGPKKFEDQSPSLDKPYYLDANIIAADLAKERPQWILSAYGPGRNAPLQLFGGYPREQSFEELRYRHYQLAASGNQQQAVQEAQELFNSAERQIQTVLNDVDGAIRYIVDGEKQHPNRLDVLKERGRVPSQQPQVGGNTNSTATFNQVSAFNNPPSLSAPLNAMSAPFGRPSTSFGQPSAPGSSFGNPSALIPPQPSFGQPPSAFGQPSILNGPQGGALGQAPSSSSAMQPTRESPFGQVQGGFPAPGPVQPPVSALTQSNNPFGQNSGPPPTNTLGQPPAFGNPPSAPRAFGEPSVQQQINPVGQSATTKANPFAVAGSNRPSTVSGQPSGPTNSTGPLGTQTNNTVVSSQADAKRDSQGKLVTWKGKPVHYIDNETCYMGNDGGWVKIWFPDGPPVFNKAVELPENAYDEKTKESYRYLREHGTFKDGIMPELPPRREWCHWNF